jgi:hypothetical protein
MCPEEMFSVIYKYAEKNQRFDTSFVQSVEESYDRYGELTISQEEALGNIIKKFRMR